MSSCMSGGIISRSSISRSKISPGMSMISSHIVSVTVEKICDCFLIFFVGSEAISEAGRHLARAGLCLGEVSPLSEDLLLVNVVCFVHAPIISTGFGGSRPLVCHLANWLGRLTSLYHLAGKFLQTESHKALIKSSMSSSLIRGAILQANSSTMPSMSHISCSRAVSISS